MEREQNSKSETVQLRLGREINMKIEDWRGGQRPIPTKSESLRRLIEIGLSAQAASHEAA